MELGVLSLVKWSALAGLSLLTYFKARRLARRNRPNRHAREPILLELKDPIPPLPTLTPQANSKPLLAYSQFVSIYQDDGADDLIDEECGELMEEPEEDAYKSDQFSTMGGDTRRETLSLLSEDLPSHREEIFEQYPSTPNRQPRIAHRQWTRNSKCLRREGGSAGRAKAKTIRKDWFTKRDSRREEMEERQGTEGRQGKEE